MADWKKITQHLYDNIQPVNGFIGSMINESYKTEKEIYHVWIEFEMNEFIYEDPFYGESSSTSMFATSIDLKQYDEFKGISVLKELEGKEILNDRKEIFSSFSNSLDITTPRLKFGNITNNQIAFEMEYCLTNTESYGMMTGNIEDHVQNSGTIKMLLTIEDPILLLRDDEDVEKITAFLNPAIYHISTVYKLKNVYDNIQHQVPFNNILSDEDPTITVPSEEEKETPEPKKEVDLKKSTKKGMNYLLLLGAVLLYIIFRLGRYLMNYL